MAVAGEANAPQRLLALCKEYAATIGKAKEEVESIARQWGEARSSDTPAKLQQFLVVRCKALSGSYSSLQGGVQDLVRGVSQQLEHSQLAFGDRLELRLRLAELEGKLVETQALLSGLSQLIH